MYNRSFAWELPEKGFGKFDRKIEKLWAFGFLIAALVLFTFNLGGLPLRDWDEGTVAQVAREIAFAPEGSLRWLFPTLGGEPYLNKPPLIHLLIAGAYTLGGVNEWTTRLPAAIITAFSVPLLYFLGREIFKNRTTAIFSTCIYLTLLPVVRHGRLAMLDGAVLCFSLLMMLCILRSRRDLRYCLGVGIGFGLIALTKGIMALLLGAIAFIFLLWDTPRLLACIYLWGGVFLGSIPVLAWYTAQWFHYGQEFLQIALVNQSFQRIWTAVENNGGSPWYYLLEIVKYSAPWLLLLPQGIGLAWKNRNWSWAKLILVWGIVYLVAISLMGTKLPWYVIPVYPAIALACGAQLAHFCDRFTRLQHSDRAELRFFTFSFGFLGLVALGGSLYFAGLGTETNWHLQLILASAALTFLATTVLVIQKDLQFISILFWGFYITLLLFTNSPHWVWELAEAYPVKPVAVMIQQQTPPNQQIYTSFPYARPSLNFYSDRKVIPASNSELIELWHREPKPYFLLNPEQIHELNLQATKSLATTEGWSLFTKN